jgi:hypothetical protein
MLGPLNDIQSSATCPGGVDEPLFAVVHQLHAAGLPPTTNREAEALAVFRNRMAAAEAFEVAEARKT